MLCLLFVLSAYFEIAEYVSFSLINVLTFNFGSSFAAKASKSVVFPELGGPKSNAILNRRKWEHYILVLKALANYLYE